MSSTLALESLQSLRPPVQNKLLTDVADGPLLRGLHLGPRPSLHLQVGFRGNTRLRCWPASLHWAGRRAAAGAC